MFSIHRKKENGFDKIILQNEKSLNYATILPACSALLHEFGVILDGAAFNVIDHYDSMDDFTENVIEKGFKGCKLSPFVCRIENARYTFGDKKFEVQKSLPAKHALHGELYDRPFDVVSENADETQASITLQYEYRGEDTGYPFKYDCIVTWKLEEENKLTVTTECINKDEGLIPMQDGWHPYFKLSDSINDLHLEFQSKNMLEFNADLVPTGNYNAYPKFDSIEKIGDTVLDNCFTLDLQECQPLCVLRNPEKNIEVQLFPDKSYPYLQIYTPAHRRSIAIENISGAPNAFNNHMGISTLEPGTSALFKTSYKIVLSNKA